FHANRSKALHIEKADNNVGDLDAGVVNVILDLNGISGVAKDARHGISEDGVAEMADVRGFVGVDAGVLDDDFSGYFRRRKWRVTSGEWRADCCLRRRDVTPESCA